MTNTNMRKGFTMIELIFVIVIIGILAAVAIPKLAANRTDAQAQVCVHEVGQLLTEISSTYTTEGYTVFKDLTADKMTNIFAGTAATLAGKNGIVSAKVDTAGVDYYCDGIAVVNFKGATAGSDYNLTVTAATGVLASPAATQARDDIKENMLNGAANKIYSL